MSLPGIRALTDPDRRENYDFSHYSDHLVIAQVLAQLNIKVTVYPLNPVSDDRHAWAAHHQAMHDEMNKALQTAGRDLSDGVFGHEWVNNNYMEHVAVHQVLGI